MATVEYEFSGYVTEIYLDRLSDEQVAAFKDAHNRYLDDYNYQFIKDIDDFYEEQFFNSETADYFQGFYCFTLDTYFTIKDDNGNIIQDADGNEMLYLDGDTIEESTDPEELPHLKDGYYCIAQKVGFAQKNIHLKIDNSLINRKKPFDIRGDFIFDIVRCSNFPTALNREVNFNEDCYIQNCTFNDEVFVDDNGDSLSDCDLMIDDYYENIVIIMQVLHGKKSIVYIYDDKAQNEKEYFFDQLDKTLIDMPIYDNNLITNFVLEQKTDSDNSNNYDVVNISYKVVDDDLHRHTEKYDADDNSYDEDDINEDGDDISCDEELDDDLDNENDEDVNYEDERSYSSGKDDNYQYRDDEEYDIDDKDDGEYKR